MPVFMSVRSQTHAVADPHSRMGLAGHSGGPAVLMIRARGSVGLFGSAHAHEALLGHGLASCRPLDSKNRGKVEAPRQRQAREFDVTFDAQLVLDLVVQVLDRLGTQM